MLFLQVRTSFQVWKFILFLSAELSSFSDNVTCKMMAKSGKLNSLCNKMALLYLLAYSLIISRYRMAIIQLFTHDSPG